MTDDQRRAIPAGSAGFGVAASAAFGLAAFGLAVGRVTGLSRAPAETEETRRQGLRCFRAPAGDDMLFARTQRAPADTLPPLLLVHGLVVSSKVMEPLMGRLARQYRVLAPDLPGYGESSRRRRLPAVPEMADRLAVWLRGLGIDRALAFGLSFGCTVVAELAVRHPGMVERLVLQGPAPDPVGRSLPVALWRDFANGYREPRSSWRLAEVDYAKIGPRNAAAAIRLALNARIETALPHVAAPTLVICGDRDRVAPVAWARHLAGLLPDGRLTVLEGAAHVLPYGEPDRLAAVMLPFLAGG